MRRPGEILSETRNTVTNALREECAKRGLRARVRPGALISICFFLACLSLACDSRAGESDAEADRNSLIVLSSLLRDATNVEQACARSVGAGFACAEETGLGAALARESYAGVLQLLLSLNATPTSDSATSVCSAAYASSLLARASATSRVCWFQCEANFWNTALAADNGPCGPTEYANLVSRGPGEILACFNSCLSDQARFYY